LDNDSEVFLFSLQTGKILRTLRHRCPPDSGRVRLLGFSPDARHLATATEPKAAPCVHLWDVREGRVLWSQRVPGEGTVRGAFSADGWAFLYFTFRYEGGGDTVWVRDSATGRLLRAWRLPREADWKTTVFAPGAAALASLVDGHTVRLWEPISGRV